MAERGLFPEPDTPAPSAAKGAGWTFCKIELSVMDVLPKIGLAAYAVYSILARHANAKGEAWPSAKTLMTATGLKRRAIFRALATLLAAGLIIRESQKGKVSAYRLTRARRCTGQDDTRAPECAGPAHVDALTRAPGCTGPVHVGAHRTRTINENHQREPSNKKSRRRQAAAASVEIPASLDTAEFREAIEDWHNHLKEKTKKSITPTAARLQMKKMEVWGVQRAIAALRHSAESNYIGLFEPNGDHRHGRQRKLDIGAGQRHPDDSAQAAQCGKL